MRNRTQDSTTAPLNTADRWFITEKGLRASGAASMQATARGLRQTAKELEQAAGLLNQDVPTPTNGSGDAPPHELRRGTVCGRYRNETRVPDLRLSGKWLRTAGFELGQKYQIKVTDGQLTICAE